jgi:hypothetical protein
MLVRLSELYHKAAVDRYMWLATVLGGIRLFGAERENRFREKRG